MYKITELTQHEITSVAGGNVVSWVTEHPYASLAIGAAAVLLVAGGATAILVAGSASAGATAVVAADLEQIVLNMGEGKFVIATRFNILDVLDCM